MKVYVLQGFGLFIDIKLHIKPRFKEITLAPSICKKIIYVKSFLLTKTNSAKNPQS